MWQRKYEKLSLTKVCWLRPAWSEAAETRGDRIIFTGSSHRFRSLKILRGFHPPRPGTFRGATGLRNSRQSTALAPYIGRKVSRTRS